MGKFAAADARAISFFTPITETRGEKIARPPPRRFAESIVMEREREWERTHPKQLVGTPTQAPHHLLNQGPACRTAGQLVGELLRFGSELPVAAVGAAMQDKLDAKGLGNVSIVNLRSRL